MDARGWVPGGGGNFSARLGPNRYLLTASGRHKGRLRAEQDFLVVDAQGQPEDASRRPSAETLLHCERLNVLPEVACVLHGHSPHTTVLSRSESGSSIALEGFEMLKGLGGIDTHDHRVDIPLFDNDQDIARLASVVAQAHAQSPILYGYVIRGHGLYAWGRSVEEAYNRLESLEFLLHCALLERNGA